MSGTSGSYNAVTWLLDRNVDEGRGGQARLHRYRLRTHLWRSAAAEPPRRQHAAPARRPPRRARGDDHARHGRLSRRLSRCDPRRHRAGAAQHAADVGSICLCAGGLPRARAVHLRSAVSRREGHRRADARSRACRGVRQATRTATRSSPTSWRARAIHSRPPRPMPRSPRSGSIRPGSTGMPKGVRHLHSNLPRRRTPMPDRCSAFARTMSVFRRQSCSSPMASAMR